MYSASQPNKQQLACDSDKERVLSFTQQNSLGLKQRFLKCTVSSGKFNFIDKLASERKNITNHLSQLFISANHMSVLDLESGNRNDLNGLLDENALLGNDDQKSIHVNQNKECTSMKNNVQPDHKLSDIKDVKFVHDFSSRGLITSSDKKR